MTVQGEADAKKLPPLSAEAATTLVTELYAEWFGKLTRYIQYRLPTRMEHQAEDLAQDTFAEYWTCITTVKAPYGHPVGLLYSMVRHRILDHLNRKAETHGIAVDFTDPVYSGMLNHSYAGSRPDMAALSNELDAAMERMTRASKAWRELHMKAHHARTAANARAEWATSDIVPLLVQQQKDVEEEQAKALVTFRATCAKVGELRAEMEALGGANFRTSSNTSRGRVSASEATYSISTHCSNGHEMTLENTHFEENYSRVCRQCKAPKNVRNIRYNIPDIVLERARLALLDPADERSAEVIANSLGLSRRALCERLPDEYAEQQRRLNAARQERRDKAEKAFRDSPELTIQQVAELCGISAHHLKRLYPEEVAKRRNRANRERDFKVNAARQMLTSTSCSLTLSEIAGLVGLAGMTMRYHLRAECDAYVARRKAEPIGAGR